MLFYFFKNLKRFFRFEMGNEEIKLCWTYIYLATLSDLPCVENFFFFFSPIFTHQKMDSVVFLFFYNDTIIMKKEISDTKSIPECMAKLWHKQLHSFFKVLVIMLWNDEVTRLNLLTLFFFLMQKLSFKIQYHFHQIERKIN